MRKFNLLKKKDYNYFFSCSASQKSIILMMMRTTTTLDLKKNSQMQLCFQLISLWTQCLTTHIGNKTIAKFLNAGLQPTNKNTADCSRTAITPQTGSTGTSLLLKHSPAVSHSAHTALTHRRSPQQNRITTPHTHHPGLSYSLKHTQMHTHKTIPAAVCINLINSTVAE